MFLYQYEQTVALRDINLIIEEGDFLAIIGPNGSGKSTLLKIILGLIKPTKGEVFLFEKPVSQFKEKELIGYVSQKSNSFNTGFPATVAEVVRSGLVKKVGLFHRYPKKCTQGSKTSAKISRNGRILPRKILVTFQVVNNNEYL